MRDRGFETGVELLEDLEAGDVLEAAHAFDVTRRSGRRAAFRRERSIRPRGRRECADVEIASALDRLPGRADTSLHAVNSNRYSARRMSWRCSCDLRVDRDRVTQIR